VGKGKSKVRKKGKVYGMIVREIMVREDTIK
jgi:hypothetical protein